MFEFRELRSTHKIHIFNVSDNGKRSELPICKKKVGSLTYPIELEDVDRCVAWQAHCKVPICINDYNCNECSAAEWHCAMMREV